MRALPEAGRVLLSYSSLWIPLNQMMLSPTTTVVLTMAPFLVAEIPYCRDVRHERIYGLLARARYPCSGSFHGVARAYRRLDNHVCVVGDVRGLCRFLLDGWR